ncbi:hypothetical protein [Fodinicurvata fenggangensis]|uniref:hypothetical protein n=1 Tax=Fodinicurvata fenggangensis TaxID=1121830 RepID=UPI00047AB872|nr:hypothetical protein [Fodinicurvata fenggangensis]
MTFDFGRTALLLATGLGAVLLSTAAPAQETEPLGSIEATIAGEAGNWETLAVPADDAATATFRIGGQTTHIAIQGHDPQADSLLKNVLNLEATLAGSNADAEVLDAGVNLFPDGLDNPFYVSEAEAGAASITFDSLELGDSEGRAEGSFTATICRREGIMAEADSDDCRRVEGRFSTGLQLLKE